LSDLRNTSTTNNAFSLYRVFLGPLHNYVRPRRFSLTRPVTLDQVSLYPPTPA